MRRTYAYNSIIIGFLLGILVYATSKSVVLGIVTGLGVSVVGFIIIRAIEKAIDKGVDKASEKISQSYHQHKEKKAAANGADVNPHTTQMPAKTTTQFPGRNTSAHTDNKNL